MFPHRQFVVEAFQSDHQPVLSGHQFVLELSHVSLVGRLCQVVSQDVHKEVEQDQTGRRTTQFNNSRVCVKTSSCF